MIRSCPLLPPRSTWKGTAGAAGMAAALEWEIDGTTVAHRVRPGHEREERSREEREYGRERWLAAVPALRIESLRC